MSEDQAAAVLQLLSSQPDGADVIAGNPAGVWPDDHPQTVQKRPPASQARQDPVRRRIRIEALARERERFKRQT